MNMYKKVTYEDIEKIVEELTTTDWCKPIGPGLYKTGSMIHGEGMMLQLQESLKEEHRRNERSHNNQKD